jgi:hypothetical protein
MNTLARISDPIMESGFVLRDGNIRRVRSIPQSLILNIPPVTLMFLNQMLANGDLDLSSLRSKYEESKNKE